MTCKAFRAIGIGSIQVVKALMPNLAKVDQDGNIEFINVGVKYILETNKIDDKEHFFEALTTHLSKQTGEENMTIAEMLRQEERQKGRQEVAMAMLELDLPTEQIAKITQLSIKAVKELGAKQQRH